MQRDYNKKVFIVFCTLLISCVILNLSCFAAGSDLLAEMIAREANEANNIKHNAPVMVMVGNPPYSVSSTNKDKWILGLLDDYKKNLNEKNIQPLSDDYIKFIRLGQYYIERFNDSSC